MMNLDTIFDNIDEYENNIDNLVNAFKQLGIKDYDEVEKERKKAGADPIKPSIRHKLQEKFANSEEDDWQSALAANTEEAYRKYLDEYQDGSHRDGARERISQLKETAKNNEAGDIWDSLNKSSIDALQQFIDTYPQNEHRQEAVNLLKNLRREAYLGVGIQALTKHIKDIKTNPLIPQPDKDIYSTIVKYINDKKISVDDLLSAIKDDNNFISSQVANLLWENGIITDFADTEISSDFIAYIMSGKAPEGFKSPDHPIDKITKSPCTEVYFWGIPSSGKSCALGAILSVAKNGTVAKSMQGDNTGQKEGYGYMERLSNLFKANGSVSVLPEGTAVSSTYEMGFTLKDNEGNEHPITCIDLAGELIRCMFKKDAGEHLDKVQDSVLTALNNILIDNRTNNRKIHFFVIEYGAEDREYEGLPQDSYLRGAVAYIKQKDIFKKNTDGLYIIITKVDKAHATGKEELQNKLRDYMSQNYQGFYHILQDICKDNEINNGKVEILPFTLGKVCFQNYCKFDDSSAAAVVRTIMARSYGYKPGKLKNFFDKLSK